MAAPTISTITNLPTRESPENFDVRGEGAFTQINAVIGQVTSWRNWATAGVEVIVTDGVTPVTNDEDTNDVAWHITGEAYNNLKINAERNGATYPFSSISFGVPVSTTADGATKSGAGFISVNSRGTITQPQIQFGVSKPGYNFSPSLSEDGIANISGARCIVGQEIPSSSIDSSIRFYLAGSSGELVAGRFDDAATENPSRVSSVMVRSRADLRYAPISSASRLKDGIRPAVEPEISPLRNVSWTWGGEMSDSEERKGSIGSGLIADDVAAVFEHAAIRDDDGTLMGYNPQPVIGALVQIANRLKSQIDAAAKRLDALTEA